MTPDLPGDYQIRATLPAALGAVEDFLNRTRKVWEGHGSRQDDFAIELLLRETLTNAVVHGSGSDPNKTVTCVVLLKQGELRITVRDDGAGFDWQAAWHNESSPGDSCGRGMEILQKYATRVKFNGAGNQVAIARHRG